MDCPPEVSGAACHFPEVNFIFVNRKEFSGRRYFNIAHETFHLLTWDSIKPEKLDIETDDQRSSSRTEKLAENFSAGLLLPEGALGKKWKKYMNLELHKRINETAREMCVSSKALYWRLINLKWINKKDHNDSFFESLRWHSDEEKPKLYSKSFIKKTHDVLKKGFVSVRKVAELLDFNIEDIENMFTEYDMEVPFAL